MPTLNSIVHHLQHIHADLREVKVELANLKGLIVEESRVAAQRHAEIMDALSRPKAVLTFGKPQPKKE